MKLHFLSFLLIAVLFSCKNNSNPSEDAQSSAFKDSPAILQKIAKANGFDQWKNVKQIDFTFNADFGGRTMKRTWQWKPQKNEVAMITPEDTINYSQTSKMNSREQSADKAFINDKYWLLFPFQLIWDKGFSSETNTNATAPISGKKMTEITIAYNEKDGYTPGDTYKIFVDDDHMIREWAYYPGGSKKPKTTTTWETYKTMNGVKIATMHKSKDGSMKLYFTNVEVN